MELNRAARQDLMRVPGIGSKGAVRILAARRLGTLRDVDDLRAIGLVNVTRLAPYVLLNGRRPRQQLRLF
ncbi:MAG: hypothetical protein GYB65_18250 [Chloroflexi bacterium]|nr:hypothetical protein [Chloroflexota bacterium]